MHTPIDPSTGYRNADAIIARSQAIINRQKMVDSYRRKKQTSDSITWIATLVIIGLIAFFAAMNWDKLSPIVGKAFDQLRSGNSPIQTSGCRILEFASDGGLKKIPTIGSKWCIADQDRATWLLYNNEGTIDALAGEITNLEGNSDKETVSKAIKLSFTTFVIDLQNSPPPTIIETTEAIPATAEPTKTEEPQPTETQTPVPPTSTSTPETPTPIVIPTQQLSPTAQPTTTKSVVFNINQTPDEHPIIPISQLKQWTTRWSVPFVIMSSEDLVTRGNKCISNQVASWPIVEFEYNKGAFAGYGYFYVDFTELEALGYRSTMNGCPGFFNRYYIGDRNNVGYWDVVQEFGMYFFPWKKGPSILP